MRWTEEEKEKAKNELLEILQKSNTIYTVLYHVSRSGLTRRIKLYVCTGEEVLNITYLACKILDRKFNDDGTMTVTGVGADVGFETVYNLSYELYKDGYKLNHRWL